MEQQSNSTHVLWRSDDHPDSDLVQPQNLEIDRNTFVMEGENARND